MRVSRFWRQVASSKVTFTGNKKKHFGELTTQIRNQLSGDQPLDVEINASTCVQFETSTAKLLREHVSRFRTLNIRVPMYETAEALVSSLGGDNPAPLLERLEIHLDDETYTNYPDFTAFPNSFYPCPQLRHLTIPGEPLPVHTAPHFKNLTSLTIDAMPFSLFVDLDQILHILDSTKDLQHFTYASQDMFNYRRIHTRGTISTPHLISADVTAPGCGLALLRKLNAPNLTNVRFDGFRKGFYAEEWVETLTRPISSSLRLLSKRSPNIIHLELRSTEMHKPDADYQWLLSDTAFPRLEVLRLDGVDITDNRVQLGAGRMPSLKRLELLSIVGISGKGILKFAQGRNRDFELLINGCPDVKPEELAELKKIVKVL